MLSLHSMQPADVYVCELIDKICFSSPQFSAEMLHTLVMNPNASGVVAYVGEDAVGYSIIAFAGMEGDLLSIAILPEHQGKGYGKILLEETLSHAKTHGLEKLFLEVRQSNTSAKGLYGFYGEKVGERKNYYQNPTEDADVYALDV